MRSSQRARRGTTIAHELFQLLNLLDKQRLSFNLNRYQPDSITVTVTLVGERIEIDVFEDGHIEYSCFKGDESVESGASATSRLYERLQAGNSD